jgi:hypothetical protein
VSSWWFDLRHCGPVAPLVPNFQSLSLSKGSSPSACRSLSLSKGRVLSLSKGATSSRS